jgi:hypothetical protein
VAGPDRHATHRKQSSRTPPDGGGQGSALFYFGKWASGRYLVLWYRDLRFRSIGQFTYFERIGTGTCPNVFQIVRPSATPAYVGVT